MKEKIMICFLTCSIITFGQVSRERVIFNQNGNSLEIISSSEKGLTIEYTLGNFIKSPIEINGQTFYSINLFKEGLMLKKGYPELPKITRSISIPGTSDYKERIVSSEYVDIYLPIGPSKGILSRTVNPDEIPYTFSSVYSDDIFYPADRIKFGNPYIIRNVRGTAFTIYPFAYNAKKKILRVYTKLEIEIVFSGTNLINSIQQESNVKNKYFEPIYKTHFINYEMESNLKSTKTSIAENGSMLIISDNDFEDEMQPFKDHKINMGIPTEIVTMGDVGGNGQAEDIASYIQDYYDNDNSLTFVLLVGDSTQIPTFLVSNGGSDPSFSLHVINDDNYPDIIIGRFSAERESDVETMVRRSILYEDMNKGDWFKNGIGIASDDDIGNDKIGDGDEGEFDWEHLRNIRTDLLYSPRFTTIYELYDGDQEYPDEDGDPNATDVSSLVNEGVSIINYTGHGTYPYWTTSGFSATDVSSLTNDDMLPYIFSAACQVGNFTNASSPCLAESWLRAVNSSTGRPTGAIGFYGSSIDQLWQPPMEAQDEFNSLLGTYGTMTFGALCYNASCFMMDNDDYGSGDEDPGTITFLTWNIFGDPSINVSGLCPDNLTLKESIDGGNYNFSASNTITASNSISDGAEVKYWANGSITLSPGFEVESGCTFNAKIADCGESSLKSTNTKTDYSDDIVNRDYQEFLMKQSDSLEQIINDPVINIYPNPILNGQCTIEIINAVEPQNILIYNSSGSIVYNVNNPGKNITINNIKEKGLILIKVNYKSYSIVKKVITK